MRARTRMLTVGIGAALATGYAWRLRYLRALRAMPRPSLDELTDPEGPPLIVVLGAGFAGVNAARELARLLPRQQDARILLIDETPFLLFTPMLTEVVGGKIDLRDVASPVRRLSPRITFLQARVQKVDIATKQLDLLIGTDLNDVPPCPCSLRADQIVFALGSVTNYHHVPGLKERALTIKCIGDAGAIHDRALALLERADAESDEQKRRALLTFVVGGGGFSGVETMAALNSLVRSVALYYPGIRDNDIRTVLVHPHDRLLPELGPRLGQYAQKELEVRGVEVILNTKIDGAGDDYVDLHNKPRMPAQTIIWTAGVTPNPIVRELPCNHGKHHGVATDSAFRVADYPGIWAVGDCAEVPRPGSDETYTATAQNATRQGTHVARNIVASMRGGQVTPFVYRPIGELAIVGERAGVAEVYGIHVAGLLAWLLWRAVYLAKEPSSGKRLRTAVDWLLDLAGPGTLPEYPGRRDTGAAGSGAPPAQRAATGTTAAGGAAATAASGSAAAG